MDVIGVGLSENADREKLEKIVGASSGADDSATSGGSGSGSGAGSSSIGSGAHGSGASGSGQSGSGVSRRRRPRIFIPSPGETLNPKIEAVIAERVVEGEKAC